MPDEIKSRTYLCLVCGEVSSFAPDAAFMNGCPNCGDYGTPADLDDMIDITISKHELRILSFWADNYAQIAEAMGWDPTRRMPRQLSTIRDRLSMQTDTPLSLAQEMADIRQHLVEAHNMKPEVALYNPLTGKCLECGKVVDETTLFDHNCGMTDE